MRTLAALVPLAWLAAPAAAQSPQAAPQQQQQQQQQQSDEFALPAELTDPANAEKLAQVLGVLTKAMMDLPVGEVQAAVEGRPATPADQRRTVRDVAGGSDFDRKVQAQLASAMPRMQAALKAMGSSMPAMAKALEKAADEVEAGIDRATANMPQPGYPRR